MSVEADVRTGTVSKPTMEDENERLWYPWDQHESEDITGKDDAVRLYQKVKRNTILLLVPQWDLWLSHNSQGIAYASSAGVLSVFGLYGTFLPCLVYSVLGTSRQLAVGPVSVTSLLINSNFLSLLPCAQSISKANTFQVQCQAAYNQAAIQLAFIVACIYTGIGLLQLGWLMKFLSHPVVGGFMSGAAITNGLGQAKYVFGFKISMGPSTRLLPAVLWC
ncbi:hypothetical protein CEUSTIGMA_g339.t1 [Chlamydomonas eustigma]|uniref:SLC26A/SulP transporter domain-containing protein n=1 Tax=Chlamydomonas eustigma TaxID=1157962 RepID=A0A250WPV8_9CHLO|nr:hypothetical protein CEUSTIGMA_g339.t1 [Chlamydomonas eustigma]|eukprot:GAX72884.1 hypothetical protein CEUSTIGMA_g339.t1 [Chlamydomonas eustigma]